MKQLKTLGGYKKTFNNWQAGSVDYALYGYTQTVTV